MARANAGFDCGGQVVIVERGDFGRRHRLADFDTDGGRIGQLLPAGPGVIRSFDGHGKQCDLAPSGEGNKPRLERRNLPCVFLPER